jgi:hypothetical protein
MRPVLYALLGVLIVAGLAVASAAYLRNYLHAVSAFYVPVGALVFGALCGAAYAIGMQEAGVRARLVHKLALVGVGLAGCLATEYAIYRTAYVTPELAINHRFAGVHVSRIAVPGADPMTWPAFFLREAGRRQPGGIEPVFVQQTLPNPPRKPTALTTPQRVALGLQWLGFPLGALGLGLLLLKDLEYCAPCRRYRKEQDVCQLPLETLGGSATRLNEAIDGGLDGLLAFRSAAPPRVRGSHATLTVSHCPVCGSGALHLRLMKQDMLGPAEVSKHRQNVALPGRLAAELAARLPAPSA